MASLKACSLFTPAPCSSVQPAARLRSVSHVSSAAPLLARRTGGPVQRERAAAMRVSAFQIPVSKWWQKEAPPNVIHISSVQQLVDAMAGAGERLVIIDFFAPWCAACKALYPKVMKMVAARPDVLLLAINFDENKAVVKALGVKVLPYFMFYRGAEGKLEEFSASSKRIHLIQEAIERHSTDRCFLSSDEEEPVLKEFPKVQPKVAFGSLDPGSTSSDEEPVVGLDGRPAGSAAKPTAVA